ncbi:phage terminase large subunit family protein [Afifella sp. H1R]|uniref:terminase gpA endonuclease subunit n=1 Tax=Afifella sp. H1R TaxID=2908841 RepID=UPI001F380896|nr:terminase gpA endonuclease subunit [Afifella sp. H1R]MCF1502920.1 phage terminase large subunit family protein [Afifella sp. H1R]
MNAHVGAMAFTARTLAEAIRPKPPMPFRAWLPKNIVLIDGPKKGDFWAEADAPYLGEIADCLSLEHPCNLVSVRKAQQTGVSILALAWSLYLAETSPDNILYAVPSLDLLREMNGQKLQPLIDAWQAKTGKRIIEPVRSRSGEGSTASEKRFAGGLLIMANANSVLDLSAKTCRYGIKDEVSKWTETPNGDDPEALFFGRFTAFRRQRTYKIFELSTPEIDTEDELGEAPGHCRIDRSFKHSDQRYFHVACPECGHSFWQCEETFEIDRKHPHKSVQVCQGCGHWISEMERVPAVRQGRYVPAITGPDRHPGFHVDGFMSLMMSYEAMAEESLQAEKKGEAERKNYVNLFRALAYVMKGNAPEHKRLMERREDYPQNVVPEPGLIFTGGADVQHNGIWAEAVAFAEDRQTWSVTAEFFQGATDNPNEGAWKLLDAFYRREFEDAFGNPRSLDALTVDGSDGNRANQVLEWCRRRPRCYAIKGQGGRGVPAISVPKKVGVTRKGKRRRFGSAELWPVGTWTLKSEFYANLHKTGLAAGEVADPPGYCHFGMFLGEEYFKQLTAEFFDHGRIVRGRLTGEEWKRIRRDNHFLDCRVYAMAIAEHLGLSRMRPAEWAALRARLHPDHAIDLFATEPEKLSAAAKDAAESAAEPADTASVPSETVKPAPEGAPQKPSRPERRRRPGWKAYQ